MNEMNTPQADDAQDIEKVTLVYNLLENGKNIWMLTAIPWR